MRLHIYSRSFAPAIGGMERLMEVLAREFVRQGHNVTVVTETLGEANLPFEVVRAPRIWRALALVRDCDIILSSPLSLRRLPLQLLARRQVIIAHPILYSESGGRLILTMIKRFAARLVTNVVPSAFMARHFRGSRVIPNPYNSKTFFTLEEDAPRRNLLFVGRLVPEKGCSLLLRAFAASALPIRLTVIGDGPERSSLEKLARELGIADRTDFRGELIDLPLATEMRAHSVMVVPTLCEEAFGIVALEGMACGCRMIVAESGGLPEAVGPYALTFLRGDLAALTAHLILAFDSSDKPPTRLERENHLENFRPERIAQLYLATMEHL